MRVAVLGAGPSGLLAAWAVVDAGHEPVILERTPRKPDGKTAGVYYLHERCNLPLRQREVKVLVSGGATDKVRRLNYERKVYGTSDSTPVSIPRYTGMIETAYDGMQAMELCWDIVSPFIFQREVVDWQQVLVESMRYAMVINTIPLNILIPEKKWKFERAAIYRGKAPDDESYMMYNANPAVPWYRASAVFGVFTMEYTGHPPEHATKEYAYVKKVIDSPHSMPEVPENVLLTGRYGAWNKSLLSHDAYDMTIDRLT